MTNFSNLKKLEVTTAKTVRFAINQIEMNDECPVLILAPATEVNKGYFNALLKRANRSVRQVSAGRMNVGLIEENRNEDRLLFPSHVVKSWEHVYDSEGTEVPFSVEACLDFLKALPDWIFDDIRTFAGKPDNFVGNVSLDVEGTAKN